MQLLLLQPCMLATSKFSGSHTNTTTLSLVLVDFPTNYTSTSKFLLGVGRMFYFRFRLAFNLRFLSALPIELKSHCVLPCLIAIVKINFLTKKNKKPNCLDARDTWQSLSNHEDVSVDPSIHRKCQVPQHIPCGYSQGNRLTGQPTSLLQQMSSMVSVTSQNISWTVTEDT